MVCERSKTNAPATWRVVDDHPWPPEVATRLVEILPRTWGEITFQVALHFKLFGAVVCPHCGRAWVLR